MKHFFFFFILFVAVACSSHEKPKKVDEMAKAYDPILEQNAQVARVITMIQQNKNLENEKKEKLVELVNEQDKKITEVRKEQSRLRAVLIDQLLQSADGSNSATMATSKELENLNKKNIKGLNDFILKFRAISGERDIRQNDFMREVGSVHLI
jgi:type IV secretory pathway TraG/TraD family ATPase VirD4